MKDKRKNHQLLGKRKFSSSKFSMNKTNKRELIKNAKTFKLHNSSTICFALKIRVALQKSFTANKVCFPILNLNFSSWCLKEKLCKHGNMSMKRGNIWSINLMVSDFTSFFFFLSLKTVSTVCRHKDDTQGGVKYCHNFMYHDVS